MASCTGTAGELPIVLEPMMSDVQAGAGEAGSTGGESTELTNTEVTNTGADQGGEGGQGGAAAGEGSGEGGEGGESSGGEGGEGGGARVEPKEDDVNKRFSKVTRERDEATRREREANDNLRRALEALERAGGGKKPDAATTTTTTPPADDIGPEPEPPEFIDPEQYQRDMAIYTQKVTDRTVKLQLRTERTNQEREVAERAQRTAAEEHGRAWQARRTKALEEMPDYAEVAENDSVHISQTMAIAITSSEHGPKVAYYLGQHPELAERISKMQPALQLMELGKLEAQITAPKPVKTSKTPEPIKITSGSGEPQVKSADEMSMEEYAAQRNKRH